MRNEKRCFADINDGCSILTEKRCEKCKFGKNRQQFVFEWNRSFEVLRLKGRTDLIEKYKLLRR